MATAIVNRADRRHYMNIGTGASPRWASIGEGFTEFAETKNATSYQRRYIHEATKRTDVTGYAPVIDYEFEVYKGSPVIERLRGITAEYSRGDRILAWSVILWTLYNFAVFMLPLVWNSCFGVWSSETWFAWWKYYNVPLGFLVAIVTSIWFTIGGSRDLVRLFRNLKNRPEDASDDGRVIATTTGMEREADHTANGAPEPETAWPANQTAKEIDL